MTTDATTPIHIPREVLAIEVGRVLQRSSIDFIPCTPEGGDQGRRVTVELARTGDPQKLADAFQKALHARLWKKGARTAYYFEAPRTRDCGDRTEVTWYLRLRSADGKAV